MDDSYRKYDGHCYQFDHSFIRLVYYRWASLESLSISSVIGIVLMLNLQCLTTDPRFILLTKRDFLVKYF